MLYREGRTDIRALSLTGERKSTLLQTSNVAWAGAALSPDGSWLAYASNESGNVEVFVVPFHAGADGPSISGGQWQLSSGGAQPLWRSDGKELFFANNSFTVTLNWAELLKK